MNWEMISAIVGILGFVFVIFIEWPRFKLRWAESTWAWRKIFLMCASAISAVGIVVWITGMFGSDLSLGYSTQAKIGLVMTFGSLTVMLFYLIIEDIQIGYYKNFGFTLFWTLLGLGSTIAMLYSLATGSPQASP